MDRADKDFQKSSVIERETMVGKLHGMQWLKNTSRSSNLAKSKNMFKQTQDCGNCKTLEDRALLTECNEKNFIGQLHEHNLTSDVCERDPSVESMSKSNVAIWNEDIDTATTFLDTRALLVQTIQEEEMLNMAVVESLITAKLEARCRIDEEETNSTNIPPGNTDDDTTCGDAVHPNFLDASKGDRTTERSNVIKHSDDNNNHAKSKPESQMDIQTITRKVVDVENGKACVDTREKDVCVRKMVNIPKGNIRNVGNVNLPKGNEKPSSSTVIESKKTFSKCTKQPVFIDKNARGDRYNNRYTSVGKNMNTKEQEILRHGISRNGIEDKAKDVAKSNTSRTDDHVIKDSTCNNISGKNKERQTVSKQYASKSRRQESFKQNSSIVLTCAADKNKDFGKAEEATTTTTRLSTNNPFPSESEKENEKAMSEGSFQNGQRTKRDGNCRNSNVFVTHYKNSAFSKSMQNKGMLGSIERTPITYGKNSSYSRNNPRADGEHCGDTERRDVAKVKREYAATAIFPKSYVRSEQVGANILDNRIRQQNERNHARSTTAKTRLIAERTNNTYEVDVSSTCDKKSSVSPVKIEETRLTGINGSVNLSVDETTTHESLKSCYEVKEDICEMDAGERGARAEDGDTKQSFNLPFDQSISTVESNLHSLELDYTEEAGDANRSEGVKTAWKGDLSNGATHKSITIVNTQQPMEEAPLQHIGQFTSRQVECSEFYGQLFANDESRLSPIPATFHAMSYGRNEVGRTPTMEITMNNNKENADTAQGYTNSEERAVMTQSDFPGYSVPVRASRWNSPIQNVSQMEQLANTAQPATVHAAYSAESFATDGYNNTHLTNCLPHPIFYAAPACMQAWNPQLQYPMPLFHNTPCTGYPVFSNMINQGNNFNDTAMGPMPFCLHDQQHNYVHYVQMNNHLANTGSTVIHANSSYMGGAQVCEPGNCNAVDNALTKPNRYRKKHQDIGRTTYDTPQYTIPISYSRPQQSFVPATSINQYKGYRPPNQKYYRPNTTNYAQSSTNARSQRMQDIAYEDNGLEDIPPIISPKEFITNDMNVSRKTEQFPTRVFNSEFRMRPNAGYRPFALQKSDGGYRRNTTCPSFSKDYTSPVCMGRGTSKSKRA